MPSLTLKDIPIPLMERLRASAATARRSLNREAILLLEQALASDAGTVPREPRRARAGCAACRLGAIGWPLARRRCGAGYHGLGHLRCTYRRPRGRSVKVLDTDVCVEILRVQSAGAAVAPAHQLTGRHHLDHGLRAGIRRRQACGARSGPLAGRGPLEHARHCWAGSPAARQFGQHKAALRRAGETLADAGLMISAIALARGAELATATLDTTANFRAAPGRLDSPAATGAAGPRPRRSYQR